MRKGTGDGELGTGFTIANRLLVAVGNLQAGARRVNTYNWPSATNTPLFPVLATMQCPSCSTAVGDDAVFCPKCGAKLAGPPPATARTAAEKMQGKPAAGA